MPPLTGQDLITDALIEIGVYAAGETISSEDAVFGWRKANRLFDAWTAEKLYVFNETFLQFVIKPGIQPLTIGQATVITQASLAGNLATYIAVNSFKQGDLVDVAGCTTGALNVSAQAVQGSNGKQFTLAIVNANIVLELEPNGLAVPTGTPVPNYATSSQRPAKITKANIILNNVTPNVKSPLEIRDDAWWANERVPRVTSQLPTDLYYSPDWPNGSMYLWPLPNTPYGLELLVWTNLSQLSSDLSASISLPQGYQDAVTYSLAESLCPGFGKEVSPTLAALAKNARVRIQKLNVAPPRIGTRDWGMPRSGRQRSSFNWLTGSTR